MINLKSYFLTLLACILFVLNCRAANFVVTDNGDAGPGTFRQALTDAAANGNAVTDMITFNLPTSQSHVINVVTALPAITSSVIIDASTQPGGPVTANGARVTLMGPGAGTLINCLEVHDADDFEVYGLVIKEFTFILSNGYATGGSAITLMGKCNKVIIGAPGKGNVLYDNGTGIDNGPVSGSTIDIAYCEIKNNYIGVTENGSGFSGNVGNSIVLSYTHQAVIGGTATGESNVIYGNLTISPYFDGTNNTITNNIIGASNSYTTPSGFSTTDTQVYLNSNITGAAQLTTFLISGNVFATLLSVTGFSDISLTIQSNTWGESPDKSAQFKLPGPAISLTALTGTTLIGGPDDSYGNKITNCVNDPTEVLNGDAVIESTQSSTVELSHNSLFCNNNLPFGYMKTTAATKPISITLDAVTSSSVSGTTKPNARVEVFYTDKECLGCEPETYIGSTNADAAGNWVFNTTVNPDFNVVAGATLNKISSEFSDPEMDASGLNKQDVTCSSLGSITGITATNAGTYEWYNGAGQPVQAGPNLTNAPAGQYYLVADHFGCKVKSATYTIQDLSPKIDKSGMQTTDAACGLANGSITGITPSDYTSLSWINAAGTTVGSDADLTNVPPGSYTLRLFGPNCHTDFGPFQVTGSQDVITISANSAQITPDNCGLKGGSIKDVVVAGGVAPLKYSWKDASGNEISTTNEITNVPGGTYTLNVTDASCGKAVQSFTVDDYSEQLPPPQANNIKICGDAAVVKVNKAQAGYSYKLYADNTSSTPLQVQPGGSFFVTVKGVATYYISQSEGTCESARTQVTVTSGNDLGPIPNTFTPNGDGVNDYWQIDQIAASPNALVRVFNRYGQEVYHSLGYSVPWDGTYKGSPLPAGTYYYIITLENSACKMLSGYVAIVR